MQKHIVGCWKCDFDTILFTYSRSKSLHWIYWWTRWAIRWQPTQFRLVGSLPSNRNRVASPGWTKTQIRSDGPEPLLTLILWHLLHVLFRPVGIVVAVLDGCKVGTMWELLSLLWDAGGLIGKSCVWCNSNTRCRKLSSPQLLYPVSRLLTDEVPVGCARWSLGHFLYIK